MRRRNLRRLRGAGRVDTRRLQQGWVRHGVVGLRNDGGVVFTAGGNFDVDATPSEIAVTDLDGERASRCGAGR